MKILAISGSLRTASSNSALLRALVALAPPDLEIELYEGIGALPHFNPDLDHEGAIAPPAVADLRARLAAARGVVLSTPEYAHGVPGSLKNALDWLVSSGELTDKPTIVLNASPAGGQFAQPAIVETLSVMGARVLREASRLEPFVTGKIADPRALDGATAAALTASLTALRAAMLQSA